MTGRTVRMFVCGPTVYNHIHIGNARTSIFFDTFAAYLRHLDYEVDYLQNITDVDDKIIARAHEEGRDPTDVAKAYEEAYHNLEQSLRITSVSRYARARDHIPEVIDQIRRLIEKGHAYESNASVYFHVRSFPRYGKLSGQHLAALEQAERTEENPDKKDPHDFVLWKAYRDGEPYWDSPWGKGRPGWHIEDTAITEKYFGPQYDLHGSAMDLIFPHHEAEVAQQEAATGLSPFVRYWMHAGFIDMGGEKMSKSVGNFILAKDLLSDFDAGAIRFAFLQAHYRSAIEYSPTLFMQARESIARIKTFLSRVSTRDESRNEKMEILVDRAIRTFNEALLDDFNTPTAFAAVFSMIRDLNKEMDEWPGAPVSLTTRFFQEIEALFKFGLFETVPVPEEVKKLVEEREKARKSRDWQEADRIRRAITETGFTVNDTDEGPIISST